MEAQQLYLQLTQTRYKAIYIIKQYCKTNTHIFKIPLQLTIFSISNHINFTYYVTSLTKTHIRINGTTDSYVDTLIENFDTDILCSIAAYIEHEYKHSSV